MLQTEVIFYFAKTLMDFSPRLDAYQVLTDHTIDRASYLFLDISHFEYVVGEKITEQVRKIISY